MKLYFFQFYSHSTFQFVKFVPHYFNKLEKNKTLLSYFPAHFLQHNQILKNIFQLIFYYTTKHQKIIYFFKIYFFKKTIFQPPTGCQYLGCCNKVLYIFVDIFSVFFSLVFLGLGFCATLSPSLAFLFYPLSALPSILLCTRHAKVLYILPTFMVISQLGFLARLGQAQTAIYIYHCIITLI